MRAWLLAGVLVGCASHPLTTSSIPADPADASAETPDGGPIAVSGEADGAPANAAPDDAGATLDAAATDAAPPPPAAYVTTDDLAQALAPVPLAIGPLADAGARSGGDSADHDVLARSSGSARRCRLLFVRHDEVPHPRPRSRRSSQKLWDGAQGVGLSFLRQPMGASDFSSVGNFSYDDGASDPTLAGFNLTQDLKATIRAPGSSKRCSALNPSDLHHGDAVVLRPRG